MRLSRFRLLSTGTGPLTGKIILGQQSCEGFAAHFITLKSSQFSSKSSAARKFFCFLDKNLYICCHFKAARV